MPAGRKRKHFSSDVTLDAELRQSHPSWDFTDFEVCEGSTWKDGTDAYDPLRLPMYQSWDVKTIEIARESCLATGRIHGQGRVRFLRNYRFEAVKKLFGPKVHIEPSKCQKDDNYLRKHGSLTILKIDARHQGSRCIFKDQAQAIKEGCNLRFCMTMEGANYQSVRTAELVMKYLEPERPHTPRSIFEVLSQETLPAEVFRVSNRYWQGYDAHPCIFLNNGVLRYSDVELATILGGAPHRLPFGRQACYNRVYISGISHEQSQNFAKRYGSHYAPRWAGRPF